tara:strand:- start:104 stop:751 length:648 start_codon:yes stop_codon:yes gene_type:complete
MYNAQTCQDIFVDKLLNKTNGFFVDIGAGTGGLPTHTPGFYSNTYFFETFRNWKGIAIDYDTEWWLNVNKARSAKCLCVDLLEVSINEVLDKWSCPSEIDYLSIDVDDAQLQVFNDFDFNKYRFKVLTLEHNLFQSLPECTQNHTEDHKRKVEKEYTHYRDKLSSEGYKLFWGNVSLDNYGPVEDWWVNQEIYEQFKDHSTENINCKEAINAVFR